MDHHVEAKMTVKSGIPAFVQVAKDLREKIETGALPPGSQLPSMAQLREMYSVSNTVVRDALNELRRAGLTVGQQGKGVFVLDRQDESEPDQQSDAIMRRLDDLAEAVRRLDARMTELEEGAARSSTPQ